MTGSGGGDDFCVEGGGVRLDDVDIIGFVEVDDVFFLILFSISC